MNKYSVVLSCSCGHEEVLTVKDKDNNNVPINNTIEVYINGDDPDHNKMVLQCSECGTTQSLAIIKEEVQEEENKPE